MTPDKIKRGLFQYISEGTPLLNLRGIRFVKVDKHTPMLILHVLCFNKRNKEQKEKREKKRKENNERKERKEKKKKKEKKRKKRKRKKES